MGGLGATYLATQLPGYFGSAATFSGFVQHQRPEVGLALQTVGEVGYTDIFGSMGGFYASGHNPTRPTGAGARACATARAGVPAGAA